MADEFEPHGSTQELELVEPDQVTRVHDQEANVITHWLSLHSFTFLLSYP